jgi:hypothetical protein
MAVLQVSEDLVQAIQDEATIRGLTIESFLHGAVARERTLSDRRKIEREQGWWLSLPLSERAKYEGEFVAVHNYQLVDHDIDRIELYRRVRERYGNTAVLIMPAEGPREIVIRSPTLEVA